MLAEDGRCKTLNDTANGYARGEGCGTVLIGTNGPREGQPFANIQAILRSTAVNQDGRSASLTAPNGPSQVKVMKQACREAGIKPGDISMVEMHGTGTGLGDPIEVGGLQETQGAGRLGVLCLGAAKSNIAHLEGAAGIVGLQKEGVMKRSKN